MERTRAAASDARAFWRNSWSLATQTARTARKRERSVTKNSSPPPPAGPPRDLPVGETPLAFVDLEMTGLDVERDRVVELCIERTVGGERVALVSTLLDPGERVGGAAHVHGLDAAAIAGAPAFDALAGEVLEALRGAVFVAHAAVWDHRFLGEERKRVGLVLEVDHWLDTLVLALRAFPFPPYSLPPLCRELAPPPPGPAASTPSTAGAPIGPRAMFGRCGPWSPDASTFSRPPARETSGTCASGSVTLDRRSSWRARRRSSTVCPSGSPTEPRGALPSP